MDHVESILAHKMQCFQLPKTTTTNTDKITKEFVWKKNDIEKGLPLITWDKKCMPKSKVDLAFAKQMHIIKHFSVNLCGRF